MRLLRVRCDAVCPYPVSPSESAPKQPAGPFLQYLCCTSCRSRIDNKLGQSKHPHGQAPKLFDTRRPDRRCRRWLSRLRLLGHALFQGCRRSARATRMCRSGRGSRSRLSSGVRRSSLAPSLGALQVNRHFTNYQLSLTGRCRGRLHHCALRPRQACAPELGR